MVQWMECLLSRPEDLRAERQHPHLKAGTAAQALHPSARGKTQEDP